MNSTENLSFLVCFFWMELQWFFLLPTINSMLHVFQVNHSRRQFPLACCLLKVLGLWMLGGPVYSTEFLFLRSIFPLPLLFFLQHTQLTMTVLMMTVDTTAMAIRMMEV